MISFIFQVLCTYSDGKSTLLQKLNHVLFIPDENVTPIKIETMKGDKKKGSAGNSIKQLMSRGFWFSIKEDKQQVFEWMALVDGNEIVERYLPDEFVDAFLALPAEFYRLSQVWLKDTNLTK